jgi:Zn-finger nucleic acid-binding protein
MKCPACGNDLSQMVAGEITVDVCKGGCGGIWFDHFELQKVDEPKESAGEILLNIEKKEGIRLDHRKRLRCPKCEGIVMMRHFFSVKKRVEVDECPNCGGYWLDAGELGQIRGEFASEDEKKKAAEEYFSEVFGKQLSEMHAKSEEHAGRAKKIAGMFRFICPSYYLPGKQEGGAF